MRDNNPEKNKINNNYENIENRLIISNENNSTIPLKNFFNNLFLSRTTEISVINSKIILFKILELIDKNKKNQNEEKIINNSKKNNFHNLNICKKFALQIIKGRLFFYLREEFSDSTYINYINMFVKMVTKFKNPDLPFFNILNKISKTPKPLQMTPLNKNILNVRNTRYYFLVKKLLNVSTVKTNFFIQDNNINPDSLDKLLNTFDFNNTYGTFGFESTESKIKKKNLNNINFTKFNNSILLDNFLKVIKNSNFINEFDSSKNKMDFSLLRKKRTFFNNNKDLKKLAQRRLKNGFYKNPGRKTKKSGETGDHNKYSKDNMMRKLKNKIIESARRLINQKIKDESTDKKIGEIKKIEGVYNQDLNIKYNFWLYMQPLKIIFQFKLSTKYSRDDGVSNNALINYILSQDDSKFPLTKKLLEMHFHEFYHSIFLGENENWVNEYKIVENSYEIDYALKKIEENSEDDPETHENYKNIMINLAKNYEIFFLKKNPRLSTCHKGGLYETDIKIFINSISNDEYSMYKKEFINTAKDYVNLPDEFFNKKNIYTGKFILSDGSCDLNLVKKKNKDKINKEKDFYKIKTEINVNNNLKKINKKGIFRVTKFKNKCNNVKDEKIPRLDNSSSDSTGKNENNDIERKDSEDKNDIAIII